MHILLLLQYKESSERAVRSSFPFARSILRLSCHWYYFVMPRSHASLFGLWIVHFSGFTHQCGFQLWQALRWMDCSRQCSVLTFWPLDRGRRSRCRSILARSRVNWRSHSLGRSCLRDSWKYTRDKVNSKCFTSPICTYRGYWSHLSLY